MYYSKIRKYDVSNAPGVRTTLFVSGCTNDCEGCFNEELQDFKYGTKWTDETEDEFMTYVKNPNVVGVNISVSYTHLLCNIFFISILCKSFFMSVKLQITDQTSIGLSNYFNLKY